MLIRTGRGFAPLSRRRIFMPPQTVAILGDSITRNNTSFSSIVLKHESHGFLTWLNFLSGRILDFPVTSNGTILTAANYGVSGDKAADAAARISDVVTFAPKVCIVHIGTNDLTSLTATATVTSNLNTIYSTLLAAGIRVIALPILPRSSWSSLTAPQMVTAKQSRIDINNYIAAYPGITVIPIPSAFIDIGDSDASASGMTTDGLHPSPIGAYHLGKALYDILKPKYRAPDPRFTQSGDTYNASTNPYGNLLTNGLLTGTGGSKGSGITGNVADSMTIIRAGSGVTAVASKGSTLLDGTSGTTQVFTVTTDGAGTGEETISLKQISSVSTSNFAAGEKIQAGCDLKISGISGGFVGVSFTMQCVSGSTYEAVDLDRYANPDNFPAIGVQGTCITPVMTVPSSPTSLNLLLQTRFQNTGAGAATFETQRWWIKKVP